MANTLWFGDRKYMLVPFDEEGPRRAQRRSEQSKLQKYDDIRDVEEYKYTPLPALKKRIRLLRLRSGTTDGPEIFVELVQAEYNNSFHIPTKFPRPTSDDSQGNGTTGAGGGDANNKSGKPEFGSDSDGEMDNRVEEWKEIKRVQEKYEALSWCWGSEPAEYAVMIQQNGKTYKKAVKRELALALKYLRLPSRDRTLWIDAICIDQNDPTERNHQVQMMSRLYTRAQQVCVWLGEDSDTTKTAIDFIHDEIMVLKNIDSICGNENYNEKWQALMMLMQKPWFSRRWVVQEISLASKATVYCGPDSIPWKEFAVAVELFVEVETATHRLSEVMKKDEKFRHVPGWFEYVSELGASLLVQATGTVFRAQNSPLDDGPGDIQSEEELRQRLKQVNTIDPLDRRSLLSLEYLVSTMFMFEAAEPRDTIYSLLAIARDAAPFASSVSTDQDQSLLLMSLFDSFLEEKPFVVDYSRPYSDICQNFVEFAIQRKNKLDAVQALDILCRPWASDPRERKKSIRVGPKRDRKRLFPPREEWKIKKPSSAESSGVKPEDTVETDSRSMEQYWEGAEECKDQGIDGWRVAPGWEHYEKRFPKADQNGESTEAGRAAKSARTRREEEGIKLPSWVARAAQAPFRLYAHPGIHILKTGRANADPLVGQPQDGHRNYNAAQTKKLDIDSLKFRKRPLLGHCSLYVTGFEVSVVKEVRDASQGGNIPRSWLELGGWEDPYDKDPPGEFWRTIVADRGRDNRNPPYYYARACKESVHKGGISSGRVNTDALINNERNSIVAEFCRRVHAVIWNRTMFKTKDGKLGLANKVKEGDLVCILYGCTVPVILKQNEKKDYDLEEEEREDNSESLRSCVLKSEKYRERKYKYGKTSAEGQKRRRVREDERRHEKRQSKINDIEWKEKEKKHWESIEEANQKVNIVLKRAEKIKKEKEEILKQNEEDEKPNQEEKEKKENKKKFDRYHWYEFQGECYLHGMMDGEAVREKFYKQESKEHTFELR